MHSISKSRYLSGHQCLKKLYLEKHRTDLRPATSLSLQARFDQGHSVGELAQQLFAGGKDASPESYYDFGPSLESTARWIRNAEPVIYEAAFLWDRTLAALDILVRRHGETHAIEVKSSTGVKGYHLTDASLQYWVMSHAGYAPDRFFLMHLNNKYVRNGELKVEELFTLADITDQVLALQPEVPQYLQRMNEALLLGEEPEVEIGPHCSSPFACDFAGHCWQHVPQNSVFDLSRLRGDRAWGYYKQGIIQMADLPEEDRFSAKQRLQINGVKNGDTHIDTEKISEWLGQLQYPLYFFDFETINPGIPIYSQTRPYQPLPVQYSLHIVRQPGAEAEHLEFLPDFSQDPRPQLIEHMLKDLGTEGSIVAYNTGFEKGKITALAADFPGLAHPLLALNARFADLMAPFQKGWYYSPAMRGSYSIKYVLPALCQDAGLSYAGLHIANGGDASVYLAALAENRVKPEEVAQVRKDLLAYCRLDTLAMVEIWKKLKNLAP